ncbi:MULTISPECIES: pyridoxal phosphate-dependent aminotransferase [unclassified Paracoccus (in: a-proteobacteria)]|uniref:pyridoxal phosphate-dependent aminotransferase n=1 Tax=unclassified Paracoccus (in: a-proteobacteria) TaxID=2688777 RepID=UPI0015FF6324|nr:MULTISPECIES: pyridoxal phosphate-dependent aminotransferase [unclassified Paracoccus (in: a-proteobacteria)]MBB1491510.1 pyridoxal phosphate-dependent aminotransferase [Paracoccus sp. MC1854]MBB1497605.1 pyridoxal phosphate-dependent aminotransferase [Paracoccus sp. MC1862]QQO44053.1 pyridoxal phosphate-dependent aminotransferase [Paracoccus sp. MC1862]
MKPTLAPLPASLPDAVPFVGPETLERRRGVPFRARLGANENGFGPSPLAIEAMRKAAAEVWKYGDPTNHDLKAALAAHCGVAPENIVVGEGIDGLLGLAVRLMVAPGDRVVTSAGGYPTFDFHVAGFGGELVRVPYRADKQDPAALVAQAAGTGARMVYLCNPDNPMGGWHPPEAIEAAIAALPEGILLILDEAYAEFAPALPRIDPADPRVLRMRTFSKAHGMAGARIGYAIGAPDMIRAFDRVRNHFGVNSVAQAGALAALGDAAHLAETVRQVTDARERIAAIARDNGLKALPSATNFVAIDCGRDGDSARALLAALAEQGIFARMPWVAPQNRCIRVSCGPEAELDVFAQALPQALAMARG